jgi:translocation and assembly module TamB
LLRATLCIDRLQAERIDMAFAPGRTGRQRPLQLPTLRLPLAIELGEVKVGQLRLDGSELLGDLQLAAHWTTAGCASTACNCSATTCNLNLQGDLQPEGDWPLQLQAQLQLPAVDGAWQLALTPRASCKDLKLDATSSGYLDATLSGQLQALAEHLPATCRSAPRHSPAGALPDTLQLNQLELDAQGDLLKGYHLSGRPACPPNSRRSPGLVRQGGRQGARLDALT